MPNSSCYYDGHITLLHILSSEKYYDVLILQSSGNFFFKKHFSMKILTDIPKSTVWAWKEKKNTKIGRRRFCRFNHMMLSKSYLTLWDLCHIFKLFKFEFKFVSDIWNGDSHRKDFFYFQKSVISIYGSSLDFYLQNFLAVPKFWPKISTCM